MTERRVLCTWRAMSGALLLTIGLMAMPAMADHPECAPGAGDCCDPVEPFTPGCDDPVCCHDVCFDDVFCCETFWDLICADQAVVFCPLLCAIGGNPCDCPVEASDEPEACGDDLNGGCNSDPKAYTPAAIGDIFCGTAWADADARDTDWYLVTVDDPDGDGLAVITSTLTSEFAGVTFIIDFSPCAGGGLPVVIGQTGSSVDCKPGLSASAEVAAPGSYAVFVAVGSFNGVPCTTTNSYTVEITDVAQAPPAGTECADPGDTILSQSNSIDIIAGSVACSPDKGFTTTENSFARGFNNIGDDMNIVCVRWGIQTVTMADETVTFNIYEDTNGGAPTHPDVDLLLLGSASIILPVGGGGNIFVTDFGGPEPGGGIPVTAGMDIVVEIDYPDTSFISGIWIGSNPNGESAPSYIRSVSCGITNYVTIDSLNIPGLNMDIVTEIRGNLGGAVPCPWDLDGNGTVSTNDLLLLFAVWGQVGVPGDFDGGGVGTSDLLIMFANWGLCP